MNLQRSKVSILELLEIESFRFGIFENQVFISEFSEIEFTEIIVSFHFGIFWNRKFSFPNF